MADDPPAPPPVPARADAPLALDQAALQRLVVAAGDRLRGDWLLLGGAAAALWFAPARLTEDVDLVALSGGAGDRLALLALAEELGLPVEVVNSAADYFLRKIPDWQRETEPLHQGTTARILRPTPTLFLLLKVARLSEEDLADCLALLAWVRVNPTALDAARTLMRLAAAPEAVTPELAARRQVLRRALEAWPP